MIVNHISQQLNSHPEPVTCFHDRQVSEWSKSQTGKGTARVWQIAPLTPGTPGNSFNVSLSSQGEALRINASDHSQPRCLFHTHDWVSFPPGCSVATHGRVSPKANVYVLDVNPFTATACKISRLKNARKRLQTIFSGPVTSAFNVLRFRDYPSTCQCKKRKRTQKGLRVWNLALLLVVFKWHHGSEEVNFSFLPTSFFPVLFCAWRGQSDTVTSDRHRTKVIPRVNLSLVTSALLLQEKVCHKTQRGGAANRSLSPSRPITATAALRCRLPPPLSQPLNHGSLLIFARDKRGRTMHVQRRRVSGGCSGGCEREREREREKGVHVDGERGSGGGGWQAGGGGG